MTTLLAPGDAEVVLRSTANAAGADPANPGDVAFTSEAGEALEVQLTRAWFGYRTAAQTAAFTRVSVKDIVGVQFDASKRLMTVYAYVSKAGGCCASGGRVASHVSLVVDRGDIYADAEVGAAAGGWVLQILRLAYPGAAWLGPQGQAEGAGEEEGKGDAKGTGAAGQQNDKIGRRRFLAVVNPVGGTGHAVPRFREQVRPMWEQAGIEVTEFVTQHADHATEHMIALGDDLYKYDAIVALGGDGLLYEVVQGLCQRPDPAKAIKVNLGVVPCGSGNGLAKSVSYEAGESFGVASSAFVNCKGRALPLDIMLYETPTKRYTGFLSFEWAIVADFDIESEAYRCCGGFRFTWGAIVRTCCLRRYRGRLWYLPAGKGGASAAAAGGGGGGDVVSTALVAANDSTPTDVSLDVAAGEGGGGGGGESKFEGKGEGAGAGGGGGEGGAKATCVGPLGPAGSGFGVLPPLADAVDHKEGWELIESDGDDWVYLWVMNPSHAAHDAFAQPGAKFDDGAVHIQLARGIGQCSVLKLLLGIEEGTHVKMSCVETIKARALRFEPLQVLRPRKGQSANPAGRVVVDGELVKNETIQMEVQQGLGRLIRLPADV
eukprot:g5332.t1